jgi:platelet-activating factor acetylhydrolase
MLVILSSILSVLFPAVELGDYHSFGEFHVGVVDMYLPIDLKFKSSIPGTAHVTPIHQDHATIRILYPTSDEPIPIPYLRPHTSEVYCEENMKHSAPAPLRPFSWMIHHWRLIRVPGRHHAQPMTTSTNNALLPVVFFSHGLGGSSEMYAFQTHALAKSAYIVVVLDHSDGSAPVVSRKDGTMLVRNDTIIQHWMDGDKELYKLLRQAMTEYRAQEMLAVVESFLKLNDDNMPELEDVGLDFRKKLDMSNIHYVSWPCDLSALTLQQ